MKIKSFLLALIVLANLLITPVLAQNDTTVGQDYVYACEFLEMLDIIDTSAEADSLETDSARVVSRAEFAAMVVKMTNISLEVPEDDVYDDVDSTSNFGEEIYTALSLGIVSESADRLFRPDDPITYETATKMVVSALGYDKLAKAKGGYPYGYIAVADDLEILVGVSSDITFDDAVILISNALRADVWVVDAVWDEDIVYKRGSGRSLLTENFHLTHTNGIATTAGMYSINKGYDLKTSALELNNRKFDCYIPDMEKYLGYSLDAWYNDKSEIVAFYPDSNNTSVVINSADVESYSDFVLKTCENDKEVKYSLAKDYSFAKNGRYCEQDNSDFVFENGTLTLIDNDGDRRYDFVIAKEFKYFYVSAVNELNKVLYDTNQPDEVIALTDDLYSVIRTNDYKYATVSQADFDDISVGRLLEVAKSDDAMYAEITVMIRNTVEGVVEEKSEDSVVINGITYKLTNHFTAGGGKVTVGEKGTFMLSSDGKIVMKTDSKDEMKYGYYLSYKENATGLDSKPFIKILTTSNQVIVYELADKVILDSEKIGNTSTQLKNKLLISGAPRYQLIKYSVNSEGKVNAIDTATSRVGGNIITNLEGNDCLTQYINKGSALYKDSGVIAPFGKFAGGAVFSVPENLTLGEVYSDDFFVCEGTSNLNNDKTLTIDIYDYSEYYVPKAAVIYVMTGAAGSVITPPSTATPYMVEAVTSVLDRDGAKTVKLALCSEKEYLYYTVSSTVYDELAKADKIPHKGDIIRISTDSFGEVNGIARDVVCNSDGTLKINFKDGVHSSVREIFTYATGKLTALGSGAITIDKEAYGSSGTFELVNNKMTYSFQRPKIILYSGENQHVRAINPGDARTQMIHGAGNEDKIVVCSSYLLAKAVFVYRNVQK